MHIPLIIGIVFALLLLLLAIKMLPDILRYMKIRAM